jgi:hypothetical protein
MRLAVNSGLTIIELLLATFGFIVIMLAVYALFSSGIKNWTIINPQLTMRQETIEALYGKAGDKEGGIVGSLQSARVLLDGIFDHENPDKTRYAQIINRGTISGTVVYLIKDDIDFVGATRTVSPSILHLIEQNIGTGSIPATFTPDVDPVICYYAYKDKPAEKYSSWSFRRDIYVPKKQKIVTEIILENIAKPSEEERIFIYYDIFGNVIPENRLEEAVERQTIAQIAIHIQRNIDTDNDSKYGEDDVNDKDDDDDGKVDEDKDVDLDIKTKVVPRMLWRNVNETE